MTFVMAGCWFGPGGEPSVVGVIERVERPGGRMATFELHTGEAVTLDLDQAVPLAGSRGGSEPGTLFFYGARVARSGT